MIGKVQVTNNPACPWSGEYKDSMKRAKYPGVRSCERVAGHVGSCWAITPGGGKQTIRRTHNSKDRTPKTDINTATEMVDKTDEMTLETVIAQLQRQRVFLGKQQGALKEALERCNKMLTNCEHSLADAHAAVGIGSGSK